MPAPDYEDLPYVDYPIAQTHPDHLWVEARARGVVLPKPETMRVLEVGCAHAVNLLPMAFHLPEARFHGIDLSPSQTQRAQSHIDTLGLKNITVECADLMAFDPGEQGADVVIAHGLFSWVPDEVRDGLLRLCRRAIGEGGLAYISYNAMPAWGIREGIRRALFELIGDATSVAEKVARARAGLETLATTTPLEGTAEGALLEAELASLAERPDAYLVHEYLVPCARAYWVRDFARLAQGAGLRLIGDVAETGLPPSVFSSTRDAVAPLVGGEPVAAEQLADILTFRQFRASLLVADSHTPCTAGDGWVAEMFVAAPPHEQPDCDDPMVGWLRERWPEDVSFSALADAMKMSPEDGLRAVVRAWERGLVQLRPRSLPVVRTPGVHPTASDLTRLEAQAHGFVTTPMHDYAPLDPFHQRLVCAADGLRTTDQIVEALLDDIEAGRLSLEGNAQPPRDQLRGPMRASVEQALGRLAAVGLLSA